jgi:hypothetical protein
MLGSCVCALVRALVSGGSGLASLSSRLDRGVLWGSYFGSMHSERGESTLCYADSGVSWSWLGGVLGSTPIPCGSISNRGKEPIRLFSSSWFSGFGKLLLSASWVLPILVWVSKFPGHKPFLNCLNVQFDSYDSWYLSRSSGLIVWQ